MTIWKFPMLIEEIDLAESEGIYMPKDGKILSAGFQGQRLCIWAEVDPAAPRTARRIMVVGTGHKLKDVPRRLVDRCTVDGLEFHVYELL